MARRMFKGSTVPTTLLGPITNSALTFTVVASGGSTYPDGSTGNFVVTLDFGASSGEEKVLCSARTGDVFTIASRGYDSTAASAHAAGANVRHTMSAVDLDEANAHINSTTSVHGIADTSLLLTTAAGNAAYVPFTRVVGSGGATPLTAANVPQVGGTQVFEINSQRDYTNDSTTGKDIIWHAAFVAQNENTTIPAGKTKAVSTVALFSEAIGHYAWGINTVAYLTSNDAAAAAIGIEVDFGNLKPTPAASLTGISLNLIGGNVGGGKATTGQFLQFTGNDSVSQVPFGIKFNAGTKQPIGAGSGTVIQGTLTSASNQITGVTPTTGYADGAYIVGPGIPSGATIVSGSGTGTLTISANATSSGAIATGGALVFAAGTGTLIAATGSNVALGLDFSSAVFATAAIFFGPGNNIKTDTVTGTKIGTGTGQKIGFWNATPVVKQALSYSRSGAGETAAVAAIRGLLSTLGLATDSTTA